MLINPKTAPVRSRAAYGRRRSAFDTFVCLAKLGPLGGRHPPCDDPSRIDPLSSLATVSNGVRDGSAC
jgi:hypothetical protein